MSYYLVVFIRKINSLCFTTNVFLSKNYKTLGQLRLHLLFQKQPPEVFFEKRRSSRPKVFCKKCVLKNFAKFTGKHLCQSLLFNKVAGLRPANLLIKRLWHRCFPVNFAKFLRTPFLTEHLRWLLLKKVSLKILQNF